MVASPAFLHELPLAQLKHEFRSANISEHQAQLVFQAMHRHGELDPAHWQAGSLRYQISAACKRFLLNQPALPRLSVDAVHAAQDGTIKLRIRTANGDAVESVIIPSPNRVTLCLSSQVGCAAGCTFCHTGTMGLLRNLQAWEILEQYRLARQHSPRPISNIVFMGMGEPFHNEENVATACAILNHDLGAGFSKRHIVVSTAGVGNRIRPFWERGIASLAISLHATTDETRSAIVPLNRQWNLESLRQILLSIPWPKRESVTIAYLLLDQINDTRDDAQRLAEWARGMPAKINLLEFNPYPGSNFKRASPERLADFRQWLNDFGVFNTLRHSRGDDVLAACGQLAVPEAARQRLIKSAR